MEAIIYASIGTLFVSWVAWISMTSIDNKRKIAVQDESYKGITSDLVKLTESITTMSTELKISFKELKNEVRQDIAGVNGRLDTFLQREIEELKKLVPSR